MHLPGYRLAGLDFALPLLRRISPISERNLHENSCIVGVSPLMELLEHR
jgi:hypothetical protein